MVEIVVNLVKEVVKCLVPPAERELGYLCNYNINFEDLKAEFEKLKDERNSIQRRVSEAKRNGEKIEEKVEKWLLRANKIIDEAREFIADEETTDTRCLMGLCPDLKTRNQHSKKAEEDKKAIVELREEAGRFDRISCRSIPEEPWLNSHKGYEVFESRLSTLKAIQNALSDLNVSIVGVYGMGGIGKTTLVKEVARQAKENKLFDQVVFSEVSQTADIRKIQEQIAEKLLLSLDEKTDSLRAGRLYKRLKEEKKVLVVLDNMWKHLDLEAVGIPLGDDHKGCKLLLTARDRNVLLSMDSKDNFSIGVLNEEEAWRLFKVMAGGDVENRKWKPIATDVAKACGGLPIALTTTARALRNKSVLQWKNALQQLRTPSMVNFEGVPREAYSSIELSFKYLQGEQLKKTLFLCSLMASQASIMDLFKYGMGLGIFQGVYKMEDARNKLYALVHELKDSCLLLEGDSSEWLYMHDVVCDVAISIACRDQNAFVVRNEDVWEWPNEDALKKCYAISLEDISIHELPQGLECPQLEFLYMSSKDSSFEINIPESFFTGMRKLRVIDFTRMQLSALPSSIDVLVNLQTLCLDQSMLGDIAIIGKLKNLEILSFLKSQIVQLPKELGELTKLRLLDLTDCLQLKVIAPNVISSLIRLEELYMHNCFVDWEVEGPHNERRNASLDELIHLTRLTTLEIDVKNDNILPEGFFARKLERFKISVGDASSLPLPVVGKVWFRFSEELFSIDDQETFRTLKLKLNSTNICKKLHGIGNVEYLCLDKLQSIKNILFELDTEGFSQLKHLHVQNNPEILCIMESMEKVPCDAFPLLESLTLYKLINLERVCHDRLRVESFNELRTIKVEDCDQLSNIFLLSTAKCLPRLERIAVINCTNIEVLFATCGEDGVDNNNAVKKIEFAQLSSLSLGHLPELTSFCCEVKTPHGELTANACSSEIMLEDQLDSPTTLFNETVVLPNLEALELNEINVEKIWHNQLPTMFPLFQSLTRLIVWNCQKLKCIFSASMVRSFEQLQHLEIFNCWGLQEIISEEGADQVTHNFVFPHLTTLLLMKLPGLRCLCPAMHTSEWPALKELKVISCDQATTFTSELFSFRKNNEDQLHITMQQPLFLFEKIFPKLELLGLCGKDILMILQVDIPQHLCGSLKFLNVTEDDSAGFPLGLLERFYNLETLYLQNNSYKEILLSDGGHLDTHVGKQLAHIKQLRLVELDDLKQLWKKDSKVDSIFQYLETLYVCYCDNLLILWPSSSVSVWNLTELTIWGCKELINLVTSSAAKSLVRLVRMEVSGCRAMKEVVTSEGDESEKEEIVFNKLTTLRLVDLDSLTSFCLGNYIFKFPSLKDLIVIGCPNMNIFTSGELITPPRVDVWFRDKTFERRWEGDINTTIQLLHQEKLLEGPSSESHLY